MKRKALVLFAFLLISSSELLSQPTTITWQGKLLDNSGNAINQNNVAMTFTMFDAETDGNQLWPASGIVAKVVNVVNGLYSLQLGTGTGDDIAFTAAMFNGKTPWLEVKVGTETLPRTEITNVPFALISNELSATGWENPGEIGKTTPNTGKFSSVETAGLKVTTGASDGKVLTSDAEGNTSWETPYTGLTNFTESNFTYDLRTGVKFTPNNAETDVDFVLQPKGTGAILAQQPDGTTAGGNNRGVYAVDLQISRSDATQVASGDYSVILGGGYNKATGFNSIALGSGNTASSPSSLAIGSCNTASGIIATAIGSTTTASGNYSTAMGDQTTASGESSTAMGYHTIAGGKYSTAMGKDARSPNEYSVAIGNNPNASGYAAIAMGDYTTASGRISTAIGNRTTAPSGFETVIGRYNTDYTPSSTTDWIATDRLFVVGNGASDVTKSNALTILKNANTTVGGSLTINGNGTNTSYLFPETRGTSGQVLQTDGSGGTSWTSPYTGLTNFTESNFTYDSKTGVKFTPDNAAGNVDIILQPKGTGGIIAQQPDGTLTGGNKRGDYAVDFQCLRDDATQVASGTGAIILGGGNNRSSGYGSVVLGGGLNIASGDASAALGFFSSATGNFSLASGYENNATANYTIAMGRDAEASNEYAVAIGNNPIASGYTSLAMGDYTTASGRISTAFGNRTTAPSGYETVLGRFNTDYTPSSTTDWIATDRLFVVGNGTADESRSNALTILKNANTTIGGSFTINGNGTNSSLTFPTDRGTSGQILKTNADGTISWANAVEPGTAPGQMQYWNGNAWVTVAAGNYGQVLEFRDGAPVWVDKNINTLNIGDAYQGGIVAYILQSGDPGYDENVRHGLIAAPADQSTEASWGCMGYNVGLADIQIGAGDGNTQRILIDCSESGIAARLCYDLVLNGYSDWFLPSGNELMKLYQNKSAVGGFVNTYYWASTKINSNYAIAVDFTNGSAPFGIEKSSLRRVRAIRSF